MSALIERLRRSTENDPFSQLLDMRLVDGGPGFAVVGMKVSDKHMNFLGGGHGGAIFALGDMAFGLASNSHDKISIGIDAHIAYVKGVGVGDQLLATAREISRSRKTAVYRVDVTCEAEMIATFTGTVHVSNRDHERID
jgi:phenylacetic acid degradation protein PaaD